MRRITLLLPLLILGPVACSVGVTGAPCASTDECPASEVCGEGGVCREKRDGEEGNCECMPGESQRCAADGTRVTCQDDPVCPFYPAGGGEASLTCECGPLGDSEGAGCDTPDAKICGNDAVLQCRQVGACLLWERTDDCGAQGLACEASAEGADPQCACPSNSTPTTLYVDPLHGNNPAEGVRPTGVQHPASCRFKRVTDALEALPDSRPATVVVTGFYREKWEKSRTYKQQDQVIPSTRNGWLYQATTRGESGTTEPTWPTVPSEQVTDGAIVWENVGPDAVHLKDEVFPLAVPSAVTLTTSDCPAGGGDACEPFKYALPFGPANGGDVATAAVSLADGSVFSGIAVVDDGAMTMASAVECSAGTATVEDAWLLGNGVGARGLTTGISAQGSCNVSVRRSVIGLVSGPGLASLTTGAVKLEGVQIGSGWGRTLPVGLGLYLNDGRIDVSNSTIENAANQGVTVESPVQVTFSGSVVRGNGKGAMGPLPGIAVTDGTVILNGTNVDGNGLSGLLLKNGTVTVDLHATRSSTFNDNGSAGIQLTGGRFDAKSFEAARNGTHGVEMGTATATLENSRLSNNVANGILLGGTGNLTVNGGILEANGGDNVHINNAGRSSVAKFSTAAIRKSVRAGMMLHGGTVTLINSTVSENRGAGIEGSANGNGPVVTITGSHVSANDGTGVKASLGRWSLSRTLVTSNGKGGGDSVGMELGWDAELREFTENKLYRNERVQLRFIGPIVIGSLTWKAIPATCDPTSVNEISCYPTGAVGIEATAGLNVDARGVLFQQYPAKNGTDFIGKVTTHCTSIAPMSCAVP